MFDEQQDDAGTEEEEDELGERIGRRRVPERIDHGGHDQKQ
jgi:hypothetical protein